MVLAAPNSIAVTSNEDLLLSADGQMSQSARDSINISTQKSLIAHASRKVSLFAAQDGFRAYAGKGKVEIQAQGDGADFIARKGIQIISTEDTVYIISPKEIKLVGDTSSLVINGSGIFSMTGGLFESKAQQHVFKGGEKVTYSLPDIPLTVPLFSNKIDITNIFYPDDFSNLKFKAYYKNNRVLEGTIDKYGRTSRISSTKNENVKVLIGGDEWHYCITEFNEDEKNRFALKILDNRGDPIPNLIFKIVDDNFKELMIEKTDENGE